ncbi:MAG: hypothetical protein VYB44_07115 [Bacteroidota bacterium]|nr:hypothetical protein [Bacteroidota bacterium]
MNKETFRQKLEKPKVQIPSEVIPPDVAFSKLTFAKKFESEFDAYIEKMVHVDGILNQYRAAHAKNLIKAGISTVLGDYHSGFGKNKISHKEEQRLLHLFRDIIVGTKPALIFQLNGKGNGIIELFSRKEFLFEGHEKG